MRQALKHFVILESAKPAYDNAPFNGPPSGQQVIKVLERDGVRLLCLGSHGVI